MTFNRRQFTIPLMDSARLTSQKQEKPARRSPAAEPARPEVPSGLNLPPRQLLRPADVLRLQRQVGNRAVQRLLFGEAGRQDAGAPSTSHQPRSPIVQRKPADFQNAFAGTTAPGWGEYGTWTWKSVVGVVDEYAQMDDKRYQARQEKLKTLETKVGSWYTDGLPVLNKLAMSKKERTSADEGFQERMNKMTKLHIGLIPGEKNEVKGLLSGQLAGPAGLAKDDPLITNKLPEEEQKKGEFGGLFIADTDIENDAGNKIGDAPKGKVCIITDIKTKANEDKYKVKQEDKENVGVKNFAPIKEGYVAKASLKFTNRVKKVAGARYADRTDPEKFPLFPHPPSKDDILQGGLGDCYLLAAVVSLLEEKPDHFPTHMKDAGGGKVMVKLYGDDGGPVNITVNKSVPVKDTGGIFSTEVDLYGRGSLWVQMLEKAYTAAGFTGSTETTTTEIAEKGYGATEGGSASIAWLHLTGNKGQTTELPSPEKKKNKVLELLTTEKDTTLNAYKLAAQGQAENVKELEADYMKLINVIQKLTEEYDKNYEVRQDDVAEVLIKAGVPQNDPLFNKIVSILKPHISGPLGSGEYTQMADQLFNQIKIAKDGHKLVNLNTQKKIAAEKGQKISEEKGHSAGESMSEGLVGPHAYTVLDYHPKAAEQHKTKMVKLRNPWGGYGRKYVTEDEQSDIDITKGDKWKGKAKEDWKAGEFWVDLSEIPPVFDSIDIL